MKKVIDFQDFLFDKIFEDKKEVNIVLSQRLIDVLSEIDHPVSNDLIMLSVDHKYSDKVSYIDYDDDKIGNLTYIIPSKISKIINREDIYNRNDYGYYNRLGKENMYPEIWTSNQRPSVGVGKVIRKIFPGRYDTPKKEEGSTEKVRNYLEEFTNLFVAERQKMKDIFKRFKIVSGHDINKYYNERKYDYTIGGSTLYSSCMKYDKCDEFLNFYSENKDVKMVILMSEDEEDKIIGRAILWNIGEIDGEEVDRKFMDRIYAVHDSYFNIFKDYAKQNGWLYKYNQNMDESEYIVDSKDNSVKNRVIVTKKTFDETEYFPYMDTMKYYYRYDKFLTNNNKFGYDYLLLTDTDGGPVNEWSDSEEVYVPYYDNYYTQSDIEENMVWSNRIDSHIHYDDAVRTDYYGFDDHIPESEAIKVFDKGAADNDLENLFDYADETYVLIDDLHDDGFMVYLIDGDTYYFHPEDKNYFILCNSLEYIGAEVYAHKEWDKDKIFKWKGEYWINDATDPKKFDDLVGQIRMFDSKNNNII